MWLSSEEYGEICHAICTKYANKIPKWGHLLYKNHFYVYTFEVDEQKILCVDKIEIEGNKRQINGIIKEEHDANKNRKGTK